MNMSSKFSKILWAIDPLTQDKTAQMIAADGLKAFARSLSFEVQPLSVILEAQIPYLVGPKVTTSDFRTKIAEQVKSWIYPLQVPNLKEPQIIVEPTFSIKSGVVNLITFAKKNSFDLIVACTHAKHRDCETEFGTFSETLFLNSQLDLLLINPKTKVPPRYTDIFFPTDLSPISLEGLRAIQPLAKSLKAHLTVFYKSPNFTKDIVEFPLSADARSIYLERMNNYRQEELEEAVFSLRSEGVSADWILDRLDSSYVSNVIVSRTETMKSCFISMVSHTSPLPIGIPGSTTRQVIRKTTLPVLILNTSKELKNGSTKT